MTIINKHSCKIILLCLLPVYAQAQLKPHSKLQQFDDKIIYNLSEHRTPEKTHILYSISQNNLLGNAIVPAGLLVGGILGNNKEMRQNSLYVASSSLVSYGAIMLIKRIVKRPRPFTKNVKIIPVYISSNYSFPSGHASSSIGTATALSLAYPKWYVIVPSYLWAGTICYSRMYLGSHYPTDVAAGAIMGAGTSVYFNTIRKRIVR